jgi:hypothetical protein
MAAVRACREEIPVTYSIAGCATSGSGSPGKSLKMINNTSVTVTMKSCPANAAQAQQCSAISRIAPGGSAGFPLSSPGSAVRNVVITGYGGQPRCFPVPTTNLPADATAYVTDASSAGCTGAVTTTGP